MSKYEKCTLIHSKNNIDCSLVNIYKNTKFAKEIPSIWTDWYNSLDSKIMVIGQDWDPFEDMKKLNEKDFIIQKKELSEVKWFDIDEVIDMINKNDYSKVFDQKRLKLFDQLRNIK